MRENESAPLLVNGFKDITESELHTEFVQPFNQGHDHRANLLLDFIRFLNEFKRLGLNAELWVDGSFATFAPDPSDIDVVFYFDFNELELLKGEKEILFDRLFKSRKFMRNLYNVEVHFAEKNNETEYKEWQLVFGTYYDNIRPKGIFRLFYNN